VKQVPQSGQGGPELRADGRRGRGADRGVQWLGSTVDVSVARNSDHRAGCILSQGRRHAPARATAPV